MTLPKDTSNQIGLSQAEEIVSVYAICQPYPPLRRDTGGGTIEFFHAVPSIGLLTRKKDVRRHSLRCKVRAERRPLPLGWRKRKEFRSVLARSSHQGPTYTLTHASILRVAGRYHLPAKNPTGCIMFGASKVLSPRLVLREACSMSTDTGGDIRFKKCHARQEQSAVCRHLNEVHNASDACRAIYLISRQD